MILTRALAFLFVALAFAPSRAEPPPTQTWHFAGDASDRSFARWYVDFCSEDSCSFPTPLLAMGSPGVALAAASVLPIVDALAATPESPPPSSPTAITETLGAITFTDGWCVGVTGVAADLWASAPARVTAQNNAIRFVLVQHADVTDSSVPVCVRRSTLSTGLTCSFDTGTAGALVQLGAFRQWAVARDAVSTSPSSPLAAPSPIWAVSNAGTVTTCVEVGY